MYITFCDDDLYRITDLIDHAEFFCNLPKLLPFEDYIIGIASFLPTEKTGSWLKSFPSLPIPGRYNFRFLTKKKSETSWGGAYYFHATAYNLNEIDAMAKSVDDPAELCSHIIAFSKERPFFNFHDAFGSDDMLVSTEVPKGNVEAFCAALCVKYEVIPNPAPHEERMRISRSEK